MSFGPGFAVRGRAERARNPVFDHYMKLLNLVDRFSGYLIIASMAAMVVLVSSQVFSRYVLSHSIDWAEEMSRLFFVWAVILAIPHGIRTGVHVGIDILIRKMSAAVQDAFFRLFSAVSAAFFALVFAQSILTSMASWSELMPTLEITSAIFYMPVIFASAHACLHLVPLAVYGPRLLEPHEPDEEAFE